MIEVVSLSKRFGATVALEDVSFQVAAGEVLGFLGPNGAGKTTAMRIITCYIPQDGGAVRVGGLDTAERSVEVRRKIGYLPESAPLYHDMGVREYLGFVGRVRRIEPPLLGQRLEEMIEICGLKRMQHRLIGTLSKGYRQRVGLAQTLIHDPEVLILDEPTSGLDPNQIAEIRDLIKRIGREKTIILSTHILPEVEATCSRVIIINEGRIVASGTPRELTSRSQGAPRVYLTVEGAAAADVEPALRESGLGQEVRLIEALDGRARFALGCEAADPEAQLFRLAVRQGWTLTELKRETVSLEQVFTRLTTRETAES
ncbi:MAG: ATP-binding cassette domain-containing protein [Candidatus Eisenbacteria bacterium]|uniref:ATP-binding cassette domain-containing protein n=1 Tax=Eiseniibacteriota bacterium TaxID=2212470 RepID=A0A938BNP2_UNCEI|nr:ATP-binding cassette domain-containing protein [Candidatus Eisenbacteria bacterium]